MAVGVFVGTGVQVGVAVAVGSSLAVAVGRSVGRAVGVLVGTEPHARVRRRGLFGREIDFTPTIIDLHKIIDGLIVAGEAFFKAGAEAVMPATFAYHEYRNAADLVQLRLDVRDPSDITLGTGHPMGGNAISSDARIGVVDPEFRVYGYNNLYVCDASVFPTAVGVNPQLTVMALADYAAPLIAGTMVRNTDAPTVEPAGPVEVSVTPVTARA